MYQLIFITIPSFNPRWPGGQVWWRTWGRRLDFTRKCTVGKCLFAYFHDRNV